MIVAILVLLAVLVAISLAGLVLLYLINRNLKANHVSSDWSQAVNYQRAVSTPKSMKESLAPKIENADVVELSDVNWEDAYEALAAHGRGES